MRKIILNLAVSIDGYIEGPNGELDWCRMDRGPSAEAESASHFDQFLTRIDTIFYGRVSYDQWGQYQPGAEASPAEKKLWTEVHSKKKYVFTSRTDKGDGQAVYIQAHLAENVRKIKKQPGKDIWLYGGAVLIKSFIELGLIDNFLLAVFPVILGGGKPLFTSPAPRQGLKLNRVEHSSSGIVLLDYDLDATH